MLQMQGKWLDGFAISASLLCLIHCLVLPIMILALPLTAVALGNSEWFHPVILMFAIPTSLYALLSGFREHGQLKSLIFGFIGILCLFLGLWIEHFALAETVLTVIGSLFLAAGHLQNIRWRRITRI
jgi:MerC mercury resistance protein